MIQGAGGAALLSTAQATLREIFPREMQGYVQSIYVLGIIMAPTLGPTLGGWITDNYSWPWVFYVNIPIGLTSAFIVSGFLSDAKYHVPSLKVDWTGIGLLAVGLGCLQYVLEEGNENDWFQDRTILLLTIIAIASLTSLLAWELSPRNKQPVINLRVLKNRDLTTALILFVALGFGLYGGIFIFPLFAQGVLGFSPTETGLVLMPGGLATGVSAIICGRLLSGKKQLIEPRILIVTGMAIFVVSMWQLGHLTIMSGEPDTRLSLILRGFGLGMLFTPINVAAFNSLKGVEIAQGASMLNLTRQLGGSLGIAVISTYLTRKTAAHRLDLVSNLYPTNPLFQQRMFQLTHAMMSKGYAAGTARTAALKIMDGSVHMQALTMSYNDCFLLIGLSVLLVSPGVFLMHSAKSQGASAAAAGAH
jgi:DHA2 family multidrug resistance protein